MFVEMPLEQRVANILRDYRPETFKDDCIRSFAHIEKRIHTPIAARIRSALADGRFDEAVALLLEHYYDPRYEHASGQYEKDRIIVRAADVDDAFARIAGLLPAP